MRHRPHLSVNLNKVALLRNARTIGIPDIERAARTCLDAGADGITVHPRPDQRHIRPDDVYRLSRLLTTETAEFNIEGNPFAAGFIDLVLETRPTQCTLVPDSPDQRTSDHGWHPEHDADALIEPIERLRAAGIRVSLFMDAEVAWIAPIAQLGADRIELYTEPYAAAYGHAQQNAELDRFIACAQVAAECGLGLNAGHDLNLDNLPLLAQRIDNLLEVSIGHALIADALDLGLAETVRRYKAALG